MSYIGSCFTKLEGWLGTFSMEVFSGTLENKMIETSLIESGRLSKRERKLPSGFVVWLIIAMSFHRSLSIQNILKRMGNIMGMGSLWEDGEYPKSSSDVNARDRVGFGPMRLLAWKLRGQLMKKHEAAMKWKGMWLLAMDGVTFKVPDSSENSKRFGLPGVSRGRAAFPQMRAVFLVSTKVHFILSAVFAPYRRGEMPLARRLLSTVPDGSLVIVDRGYNAWEFLLGLRDSGNHFLVRVKRGIKGRILQRIGKGDVLVEVKIPRALRRQHPNLPQTIILREITVKIKGETRRLFTSLINSSLYPAHELITLYAQRWEEELMFDEMKTHQCHLTTVNRPVMFRCKTSRRVLQEAWGLVIAYNIIRAIMAESAHKHEVPPLRISFVGSLERIRDAALLMAAAPTVALPAIYNDLLRSLAQSLIAPRQPRINPREVCIKMSTYSVKMKIRNAS